MTAASPATTPDSEVTVSIVTYNSRQVIGDCLDRLPAGVTVRVYDNASTDGTAGFIRQAYPQVQVTDGESNLGFGRAHNRNCEAATTPLLLVLNPDCFLTPGSLDRLVETLNQHPSAAMAGPVLFEHEPPDTTGDDAPPIAQDMLSGACLLLRRNVFDRIGYFDPGLFLFYEDTDLCLRTQQAGYQLLLVPQAHATHLIGCSAPRTFRLELIRSFHTGWSEAYYRSKHRGRCTVAGAVWRVFSRHVRKLLVRLLRVSPKSVESFGRVCGVVSFSMSGQRQASHNKAA